MNNNFRESFSNKSKITILLVLFFMTLFLKSYAQKDSNYIIQFDRPYNIQFNTWLNKLDFFINPPRFPNSTERIQLSPNLSLQTGFSLGLKYVTVAFGVQVPRTNGNELKFGKTKYYDFSFSYYQSWGGGEVYSRSFSGAYLSLGTDTNIAIRPDADIQEHGLNLFYNINYKKFSYRSSLSMAEFQRKSSGSILIMCGMGYRSMRADSSVIPANIDNVKNYGELTGMNYLRLWHLNIRPGYGYNFCFKGGKWFVAPSAFIGLGLAAYKIDSKNNEQNGLSYEIDTHAKLSIGRNGNKYFWNAFLVYDRALNSFGDPNFVVYRSTSLGVNFGYRFHKLIPKIKWL